jgi:hypothetical protein
MSARRLAATLGSLALLAPRTVAACASCISTGFGDRGYSWPYIGLILLPFFVASGIVTVLAWHAGWRARDVMTYVSTWAARLRHRPAPASLSPSTNTETT